MWYLVCTDPSFSGAGSCAVQTWVYVERFPPSLTMTDGFALLTAIVGVWGLAYCFKLLRRFLWR